MEQEKKMMNMPSKMDHFNLENQHQLDKLLMIYLVNLKERLRKKLEKDKNITIKMLIEWIKEMKEVKIRQKVKNSKQDMMQKIMYNKLMQIMMEMRLL